MKRKIVRHEFVDRIPRQLADGVVYVCVTYGTVVHTCCCGCGEEVVTPLSPTDWKLIFDGEAISLFPSIGNWSLKCRSHYWIQANRVRWDRTWSEGEVEATRKADRLRKSAYFHAKESGDEVHLNSDISNIFELMADRRRSRIANDDE